ncbi:MAG: selenocysteine-specific translation elongation factor [Chloroflexi bacterium]|nr:selenocysteine-specific translation elongation factor [Chloroflexota bacterium]
MYVLGTAGHIDHGKSALVKALTGIEPDRLREEQERGMTIDLGFAWLKLPSGQEVGIVDVPGHERFVKNMLAGVGGIDLALLVIAANEGIMPQTREHLAILDLLGIERGIVALTKKDLVDDEWLELVAGDIEELLKPTCLSGAPIVPVSAITSEGLPQLAAMIDRLLAETEPKKDIGRPRLPIDRIFTIAGAGTVVTGTLIDGSFSVGDEVEIVPPGLKSRLRGLQTHKARVNTAAPGSRVAANIVGITTTQVVRGNVLTKPGWLVPTTLLSARLRLLDYIRRPLIHSTTVSFHTGAAETMAKVRLLEKEKLQPGETGWAQLVLEEPVALVKGDHYIIRSPMETLGGGKVIEAHAKRVHRFRPATIEALKAQEGGAAEASLLVLLQSKQPLELRELAAQSQLPPGQVKAVMDSLIQEGRAMALGEGEHRAFFTSSGWSLLTTEASAVVKEYHHKYPVRSGMPRVELASRLRMTKYAPQLFPRLVSEGILGEEGLAVRLPSHQVKLNPAQQAKIDAFLKSLAQNPFSPPGDQIPEPDLLNLLAEQQKVVKVSDSVVFSVSAYNIMVDKIIAHIKKNGKVTLAEVRDLFNTSRKYAQAILEHLDEKKLTRRVGDERALY